MHTPITRTTLTALALATLITGGLAPAHAENTAAPTAFTAVSHNQEQSTSTIGWAIKESFNSYVKGPYRLDNVTYDNGVYNFTTVTSVQTGNRVELRGTGTIQFVSHCDPKTTPLDDCPLNLTFSNPRIVLDPAGESAIYFTVRTKNYMTKQWEGPHEIKVATISTNGATQTQTGDTVSWSNLATNLTAEGNQAFSNFYNTGDALAPLNLTYEGTALNTAPSTHTVADSYNTGADYTDIHKTFELAGKVIHLSTSRWSSDPVPATVLDPASMTALSTTALPLDGNLPATVNTDTQELALYNRDTKTLDRYTLVGNTLTHAGSTALNLPDGQAVMALGYNPANQQYGLLTLATDGSGEGTYTTITSAGTVTTTALPNPLDISPVLKAAVDAGATDLDAGEYYGATYHKYGRVLEPLADGSFVYAPASNISEAKLYDHLIKFNADGTVTEIAESISADGTKTLRNVKVGSNGYIYRWNTFWGKAAAMQVLKFNGTGFDTVYQTGAPVDGATELSGIFFDGTHTVLTDVTTGRVLWLDDQLNKVSEISVSSMRKTNTENPVLLGMGNGDIIFPTMIENATTYKEELWLTRLAKKQDEAPVIVTQNRFTDVNESSPFYTEINWLANTGITTGWLEADGTRTFRPATPVNRDMIAAFLYRHAGSPAYEAPAVSPFKDVPTTHVFYKEIAWLAEQGITKGWAEADGTRTFRPHEPVSREATAAFFYRYAGSPAYEAPATSPFTDVAKGDTFYKEISWFANTGITTGWLEADGTRTFRPLGTTNRDMAAAFIFRYTGYTAK